MKKMFVSVLALTMGLSLFAGETATLVKTRLSSGSAAKTGVWLSNFSKAKAYATKQKVPLIAVWSNGDKCGHCIRFESACNSSTFKNWMKTSGCVFYFIYSGDKGEGAIDSTVFHWIRGSNTSYPFVRIYWPAGKVDVKTVGDTVDGYASGTTGGKNAVSYFKSKLSKFKPSGTPAVTKTYTVVFDANGGTGTMANKSAKVGTSFTLPANAFKRTDYTFAGWAKTPTGSVAYKNKVSVKNLTTTDKGVVTLYAKWTKTTYRTYYVGLKYTITMQSGLKGYTTSSKVPGLKWTSSKYKWTGTPTKAGTYTVKFKKGTKSATRKIVVAKDAIVWDAAADGLMFQTGDDVRVDLAPSSAAGTLASSSATGLPEGLVYANGVISGATAMRGTFKVTISAVSAAGQKLTRAYSLVIGVPECCIGTFNGFVGFVDPDTTDELALSNRGTFRLSAPSNATLSAKIVTAKGTYSMAGSGWRDNGDETYTAELATTDGKHRVSVTASADTPPYESIREIGTFVPSYGTVYQIWAQRAPFARNPDGTYVNPDIDAAMKKVVGKWYFKPYAVGSQWVLLYTTSKSATVTLTVSADGTTKLAGKIGSYTISASSAVFVFAGDIEVGCVRADFPVPVTVSKKKKTLDIWTNLWFDKSNDHFNTRGEGVGGATIQEFQ